jgi:hypothetical protein
MTMKLWDYYSYWMTDAEKKKLYPLWLKDTNTQRIVAGYYQTFNLGVWQMQRPIDIVQEVVDMRKRLQESIENEDIAGQHKSLACLVAFLWVLGETGEEYRNCVNRCNDLSVKINEMIP